MTTIKLRKIILFCGFFLFLSATACARPNPKICRNKNGKFPKPGTSCRGYYECKNYVPMEKTCVDGENFNANKGRCDWEDLYPCFEKQKDKECLKENGLFLKPGTYCKQYYRCCNGKAKMQWCPGDSLFDPSKGNCEWPDLYTCIESLTTERASSTVTKFGTSSSTLETSTDPAISKSTIQKTSTIKISTSPSSTVGIISTILEPKETSTEVPTSHSTISEISTSQPTTEISTTEPTITEISTSRSAINSQSTMSEIPTSQQTKTDILKTQPTTAEFSTPQSTMREISTYQPTKTNTSTTQPTITEMSTLKSTTTEILTSRPARESSTLEPTTSEISTFSPATSSQVSSTHSTGNTISKENKEGEITEPSTIFEKTREATYSPSTVEVTTSAEVNIMCPEPNGYFPHPTDKHKFVGCVDNTAHVLTCPSNLVYKHQIRRCDHE